MFARGIPLVLLLVSSSAMALDTTELGQFGSLSLDEMMPLIDKSLQLKHAVGHAVAEAKMKTGVCGQAFPWAGAQSCRRTHSTLRLQNRRQVAGSPRDSSCHRARREVFREDHTGSDEERD